MQTFKHIKGVDTGDIGPKFGYEVKDNGWATFDHVRIPRSQMLMGMTRVEKDGEFSIVGDLRVLYSTMMLIRNRIVRLMHVGMFHALVIALRYAVVRR